jgi:putative spermidine/putrescine transport system permease protein
MLWLGIVYIGSLFALLLQSFFSIDEFSGLINYEFTLKTYGELLKPQNVDVILRTVTMAAAVTIASAIIAFPYRLHGGALCARALEGAVLSRHHAAALGELSRQGLRLEADPRASEGILNWVFEQLHLTWLLDAWLSLPVIGGNSLSISYTGTFLVFLYVWMPYMILPIQAAIERVPTNLLDASSDLGATPSQTFWKVIFPLALPGIVAGSIFTFSLTLGDYIIPQIIGTSAFFIGQAVYSHQGTAGNIPLAAAFTVVPIIIMGIYLWMAKRMGAFDAL